MIAKFAIDPLQRLSGEDGWLHPQQAPPLPDRLRTLANAGFDAVDAVPPAGMRPDVGRATREDAGPRSAAGCFSAPLAGPDALPDAPERGRRMADEHAALKLADIFIADTLSFTRIARLARDADINDQRQLTPISSNLAERRAIIIDLDVTPCLYPHDVDHPRLRPLVRSATACAAWIGQ